MASILQKDKVDAMDTALKGPVLRMPDANSALEGAMEMALSYGAEKMRLPSPQAVLERLRRGDANARWYCHYSLAVQVGEALGNLDDNIKSVSMFEYDATPEDVSFAGAGLPIHLVAWTRRKTPALTSLIAALDRALARDYAGATGQRRMAHLLDIQLVDDTDVENRIGYGSLFASVYNRPIRVWER